MLQDPSHFPLQEERRPQIDFVIEPEKLSGAPDVIEGEVAEMESGAAEHVDAFVSASEPNPNGFLPTIQERETFSTASDDDTPPSLPFALSTEAGNE